MNYFCIIYEFLKIGKTNVLSDVALEVKMKMQEKKIVSRPID